MKTIVRSFLFIAVAAGLHAQSSSDILPPQRRTATLDLARALLTTKPVEVSTEELAQKNPFNPVKPVVETEVVAKPTGSGPEVLGERDLLQRLAATVTPSGTMQLGAFNHATFPLGQAAMIVNEGLPTFLVERLRMTRDLSKDTVGILGMAFKGDSDDPRTSLAYKLRKILALKAKQVLCTDPYIKDPGFVPLARVLKEADVIFIGAPHSEYRRLRIQKPLIDVFDALPRGGRR